MTRRLVVAAFVALLVLALVASMIGSADAHGDFGEIAAQVTPDPDDPAEITIRARIVYTNDGDPVEDDAVVTYVVGGELEDIAYASGTMLRVGDGQYEVSVTLPSPGTYRVAISSENPEAAYEEIYTSEEPAPTPTTEHEDVDDLDAGDRGDDGVTISWPVVIGIVVFLALVVGVVLTAARRRRA